MDCKVLQSEEPRRGQPELHFGENEDKDFRQQVSGESICGIKRLKGVKEDKGNGRKRKNVN